MQMFHRKNGEEQPYWPAGPFQIRLPFVHYSWEFAEMAQALIMFVVSLGMSYVVCRMTLSWRTWLSAASVLCCRRCWVCR
ncbi:MAG: hypothetical protein ACI9OW_001666 [Marinobacter psychrophilus]|jgi:hypothetical protein